MDPWLVPLSLLAAFGFGLGLVLSRAGLRYLTPVQGGATSLPATALMFLALSPFLLPGSGFDLTSALIFAGLGLLYPAAVTLLNFEGTRRLGPEVTGALGNLTPIFAVLLALALLGEAPSATQMVALVVITAGMLLLFGRPGWRRGVAASAFLLPLVAALLRGLSQPVVKLGLAGWPSPFAATMLPYLTSAALLLALAHWKAEPGAPRASLKGRAWFAAVGVVNGLGLLCFYAALARGPVAIVAPLGACYPLFTLALARLLPGHAPLPRMGAVGVVVTVAGVGLLLLG